VASAIVDQIRVQITPEEASSLASHRKVDPEAYSKYLEGRFLCNNWGPQPMVQGTDLLRQVVQMDPGNAEARAELALCLQYRAFYNFIRPLDVLEESRSEAMRAIELDDMLAEAHVARAGVAHFLEYDLVNAEAQLRQAVQLNPGSVKARIHLSWLLGGSGRFDGAILQARKAIELDPLNSISYHTLGEAYFLARDLERALRAYERAVALGPNDPSLIFSVSMVEGERGNMERALALGRKAIELSGGASIFLGGYGYLLGLAGDTDEAREVLKQLLTRETVYPFDVAFVHIGLGEYEEAIDQLEIAYQQRNSQLHYLTVGGAFDPLREHPRFQALLDRLNWK
jgi:Flp pilus assembly protein TadD